MPSHLLTNAAHKPSFPLQDAVRINGPPDAAQRLPNTLSISIKGLNASRLLSTLSTQLAASAGAACHSSGGPSISGVLAAMGVPAEFALGTLRLSTGRHTCAGEVDRAVELILAECRAQGVLPGGGAGGAVKQVDSCNARH